jgi:formate hydrogenlyase subunit 6/NADH:ubiquinone oxidoreductase subunit I
MNVQYYQLGTLERLRDHLGHSYQMYQSVDNLAEPARPLVSSKGHFFAERENLFVFDGQCFRETLPQVAPFVLFGVTSCDLTAIAYQDQFFARDPYYRARREQALLVGIDCVRPCEHGFCPSVDAGPGVDPQQADLVLHAREAGDWLLLVCSDKGREAILGLGLAEVDEKVLKERDKRIADCVAAFPDDQYLRHGIEAINADTVPDWQWQQLGIQCLGCSGCTTLCPTCSCYGSRDQEESDSTVSRQRFWDSCLYEGFQREASQHNPSEESGERVRRFWAHKFGDDFVGTFGRYGCVGCGRCEQTCPGVIGVHSVMRRIAEHAPNEKR